MSILMPLSIPLNRMRPRTTSTVTTVGSLQTELSLKAQNSGKAIHVEVVNHKTKLKEFAWRVGESRGSSGPGGTETLFHMGTGELCDGCESALMCRMGQTVPTLCPRCFKSGLIIEGVGLAPIVNPDLDNGLTPQETPGVMTSSNTLKIECRNTSRPAIIVNKKAPCIPRYSVYEEYSWVYGKEKVQRFASGTACPNCLAREFMDEMQGSFSTEKIDMVWPALLRLMFPKEMNCKKQKSSRARELEKVLGDVLLLGTMAHGVTLKLISVS